MRHRTLAFCAFFLFASAARAQEPLPPPPDVDDPMLVPVPRATKEVATWEEALQLVRARSTDLRIAVEEITRAEGQQRVALAGALPSLGATGTFTQNLITNPLPQTQVTTVNGVQVTIPTPGPSSAPLHNLATGTLIAVQPVFAPRAWYNIGTASIATDVQKWQLEDVKRLIALGVANSIVGVVTAERVAELNRVGLRNALQRYALTERKAALGGANGLDVVRARQDVEAARTSLVDGDEAVRQSRESLGLALGIAGQIGVPPNVDISGLELAARTACKPAPNVDERPDVAALRTGLDLAHRAVNDVKYQFAPTVNLQSAVATTTIDTGAAPNTTWNVQAVLSIPIWEGGARYGNLRSTQAQELEAVERLEAQRRKATIEIEQARRGVSVAEDRRRVAAAARDLAAENDRLTRLSYQEGRGTSLELVTAAQSLREAEITLALREFDLVKARVLAVLALASCPW
ncbi:MAG TPA: TolC family protein [Labilithrix sp.]